MSKTKPFTIYTEQNFSKPFEFETSHFWQKWLINKPPGNHDMQVYPSVPLLCRAKYIICFGEVHSSSAYAVKLCDEALPFIDQPKFDQGGEGEPPLTPPQQQVWM